VKVKPDELSRVEPSLDDLPEAVIVVSLDGRIQSWNRAAESIFGVLREAALDRDVVETIVAPNRQENARRELSSGMRSSPGMIGVCERLPPARLTAAFAARPAFAMLAASWPACTSVSRCSATLRCLSA